MYYIFTEMSEKQTKNAYIYTQFRKMLEHRIIVNEGSIIYTYIV